MRRSQWSNDITFPSHVSESRYLVGTRRDQTQCLPWQQWQSCSPPPPIPRPPPAPQGMTVTRDEPTRCFSVFGNCPGLTRGHSSPIFKLARRVRVPRRNAPFHCSVERDMMVRGEVTSPHTPTLAGKRAGLAGEETCAPVAGCLPLLRCS